MGCSASSSSQWSAVVCPDANGSASNCVRLESFATTDGVRRRAASCELPRISIVEADAATASAAAAAAHPAKPSTACSSRCHFRTIATCTKSEVEAAASAAAYRPPNLTELSNSRMQWLDLPSPKRKTGKRFRSTLWFLESAGFSLFRSNRITQLVPLCADGVNVNREAIVDRIPAIANSIGAATDTPPATSAASASASELMSGRCTQSLPGSSVNMRTAPDALSLLSSPAASLRGSGADSASPTSAANERSASLVRSAAAAAAGRDKPQREQKTIGTVATPAPEPPDEITVVVDEYSDEADGDATSGSSESLAAGDPYATGPARSSSSPNVRIERVQVMQFRLKSRVKRGLKCARSSSLTRSAASSRRLGRFWATVGLARSCGRTNSPATGSEEHNFAGDSGTDSDPDVDTTAASEVDGDAELKAEGVRVKVRYAQNNSKTSGKAKKATQELTPVMI